MTQVNGISSRDRGGMIWLSVAGALLLIAMISTSAFAGGGVSIAASTGTLLSSGSIQVTLCGKVDCSGKKEDTCTLDLLGPGDATQSCSGGGWKGYMATINIIGRDSANVDYDSSCSTPFPQQIGSSFDCILSPDGLVSASIFVQ